MLNKNGSYMSFFSGAPAREARQRSTIGKESFWQTHEAKKIWWSPKAARLGVGGGGGGRID